MAVEASVDLDRWRHGFGELTLMIGSRFARVEPRRRAEAFLRGLLSGLPRANCWTIAEHAGQACPRGMQRLLGEAVIDTDGLRDDLRAYVVGHLGDPGAVLVVDETGDVKKGQKTVGVQRQYTGTAGRIENSQVAVYLAYAAPAGYAFIDRELYLPRAWTGDPARCRAAGVPEDVEFATKPALGTAMIARALDAGTPARWVAGDEVYGNDPKLRAAIASRGLGFVLAVARDHRIPAAARMHKAIDLAASLPARAWQRMPPGDGAKGPRLYDWALIDTTDPALPKSAQGANWLLVRRSIPAGGTKVEYAFYRAHASHPVPLSALVKVAGARWKIEESFAGSKELAALDQHQVRGWTPWRRWTIFAMLAHAFLSVMTATQPPPREAGGTYRDQNGRELIPLTRNEIRRLFASLTCQPQPIRHQLRWSCWRRRHQATARRCHYRRREALPA